MRSWCSRVAVTNADFMSQVAGQCDTKSASILGDFDYDRRRLLQGGELRIEDIMAPPQWKGSKN